MPPIWEGCAPKLTLVVSLLCLSTVSHARQTDISGDVHRITLPEAQARAAANAKVRAAELAATAARYHRQAATADYFPKVGSTFANLHFNKLMGQTISLSRRDFDVRLLNKDQSLVAVTATQPVTSLLKVKQEVNLAKADERIAEARLADATADITRNVEDSYFALLIADLRHNASSSRLEALRLRTQLAEAVTPESLVSASISPHRVAEAQQEFSESSIKVTQLMRGLNGLLSLPLDTALGLTMPVPLPDHAITLATAGQRALATNSEVIEAEQAVVKAQAAVSLSKLEYVPDVAVMGGYSYQTAVGLLPTDFSFLGVVATLNVFDFGKREKTLKERKAYLELAQMNLQAVKSRVMASVQSAYIELEEAARSRDVRLAQLSDSVDEARHLEAEADLAQAEWKYRVARQQLHKLVGMH